MTPVLNTWQKDQIERISQLAASRAVALATETEAAGLLRAAILSATGAGCPSAGIARSAGVGRQGPDTAGRRAGPDGIQIAWRAAGCPDEEAALAAVRDAAPAWHAARKARQDATEQLVDRMAIARCGDQPVPPTAVATACGMSPRTAFGYLAAVDLEARVLRALKEAGLVCRPDPEAGVASDVLVWRRNTTVSVIVGVPRDAAVDRDTRRGVSVEEAVRRDRSLVAREAATALASVGLEVDADSLTAGEGWVAVRATGRR